MCIPIPGGCCGKERLNKITKVRCIRSLDTTILRIFVWPGMGEDLSLLTNFVKSPSITHLGQPLQGCGRQRMMQKIFGMIPELVYIFSPQTNPERTRNILTAGHTHCLSCHQEEYKGPLACGERYVR